MKLLLVSNYLPDRQESMQRYSQLLYNGLTERGYTVKIIRPAEIIGKFPWPNKLKKWAAYIDKFLLFPPKLRKAAKWADVVHICDHANAMYRNIISNKSHVVTCHDLTAIRSALGDFPENTVSWTGKILQRWIANSLKEAHIIVCVSTATLEDCHNVLDIDISRLKVIFLGLNYSYARQQHVQAKIFFLSRDVNINKGGFKYEVQR